MSVHAAIQHRAESRRMFWCLLKTADEAHSLTVCQWGVLLGLRVDFEKALNPNWMWRSLVTVEAVGYSGGR